MGCFSAKTLFLHGTAPRNVKTDLVIIVIHNDLLVKDKYLGFFAAKKRTKT